MGSLGKDVAKALGDALGLKVQHHEIIDHLANRARVRKSHVISFLEGTQGIWQRLTLENLRLRILTADEIVSAAEGDVDTASDGFPNNERLFIPATQFDRFAVTREISDGLLAPRFAPSQKAWVMSWLLVRVNPSVPASEGEDSDDR